MSLIVLYFLHSTSVLSFYTDVVLTLSISVYLCVWVSLSFCPSVCPSVSCFVKIHLNITWIWQYLARCWRYSIPNTLVYHSKYVVQILWKKIKVLIFFSKHYNMISKSYCFESINFSDQMCSHVNHIKYDIYKDLWWKESFDIFHKL